MSQYADNQFLNANAITPLLLSYFDIENYDIHNVVESSRQHIDITSLKQVFQRIDTVSKDFDNIVELELGTPWPLEPVQVTATLAHKFEIIGSCTIKIVFEKTTVKTTGNLSQLPPLEIPQLPEQFMPSTNRGSGDFDVTYIDSDLRITRGDRGLEFL